MQYQFPQRGRPFVHNAVLYVFDVVEVFAPSPKHGVVDLIKMNSF